MQTVHKSLAAINNDIALHKDLLDMIHAERQAVRGYNTVPLKERGSAASSLRTMLAAIPAKRTFKMLAQGDSWFDYPTGTDIIDCLCSRHGHEIENIAVAGSTLNDEAYGPVPREMFGLGPKQSDDPDRLTELVNRIKTYKPQALLLSAGGNDVAGDEFFSFINNSKSGLSSTNQLVLDGVVNGTFKTAYKYIIDSSLDAAKEAGIKMPIFTHGYDYPWPDGRGFISFLAWDIGPWFDDAFNSKNFPNTCATELKNRHDIIAQFIDTVNSMLINLASSYSGQVIHVDLRNTLQSVDEWANELHPKNDGFIAFSDKIDAALQAYL